MVSKAQHQPTNSGDKTIDVFLNKSDNRVNKTKYLQAKYDENKDVDALSSTSDKRAKKMDYLQSRYNDSNTNDALPHISGIEAVGSSDYKLSSISIGQQQHQPTPPPPSSKKHSRRLLVSKRSVKLLKKLANGPITTPVPQSRDKKQKPWYHQPIDLMDYLVDQSGAPLHNTRRTVA